MTFLKSLNFKCLFVRKQQTIYLVGNNFFNKLHRNFKEKLLHPILDSEQSEESNSFTMMCFFYECYSIFG